MQTFFRRRDDEIPKWGFGRSKQRGGEHGGETGSVGMAKKSGKEKGERLVFGGPQVMWASLTSNHARWRVF